MHKIWIITLIITFTNTFGLKAQYSEVGLLMGATNYLGDLVPPRQFFLEGSFSIGAMYQYNFTDRIAVRANVLYGQLQGDDNNSSFDSGRRQRNLDFKTNLLEFSVMGQINLLPFHPKRTYRPITPYGFVGIGLFHFNPYTTYQGKQVYLQPLGTEAQGVAGYPDKYSLWEISIPAGIGVKFCLHSRVNLTVEIGFRKTFTDYIDDVSGDYVNIQTIRANNGLLAANLSNRTYDDNGRQIELEGSPRGLEGKDWYSFMGIGLTYSLHDAPVYFKKRVPKRRTKKSTRNGGRWM